MSTPKKVGARAQQVLDVVYRLGRATAGDVHREVPDVPSYSAVRSILRSLEKKGLVQHRAEGPRYVYRPTTPKQKASRSALAELLDTFFDGSPEHAMEALLDVSRERRHDLDFDEFERLIDDARKKGR